MKNTFKFLMLTIGAMVLVACGGGGSSSSLPSSTPAAQPLNNVPVANAGINQNVQVNALVTLNGSASSDLDGDSLTYTWVNTVKPTASTAVISSAYSSITTFTPDKAGQYVFQLSVSDGKSTSTTPSTVTINVNTLSGIYNFNGVSISDSLVTRSGAILSVGLSNGDWALQKYGYGGVVDATFGNSGVLIKDFSLLPGDIGYTGQLSADWAKLIRLRSNGKYVVLGSSTAAGQVVAQYDSNGVLDTLFGQGGYLVLGLQTVFDFQIANDDTLYVTGIKNFDSQGANPPAVFKYLSNGSLDTAWGNAGSTVAPFELDRIAISNDGSVYAAGIQKYFEV